jgi:hypothetical protein
MRLKITNYDYHNLPEHRALSSTGLRKLSVSPKHYHQWLSAPKEPPTKEMVYGSACHTLILEPDRWESEVVVKKSVSKGARDEAAAAGKYLIEMSDADAIQITRDNLMKKQIAKALFSGATFEESFFWDDIHGIRCKCRPDLLHDGYEVMCDLKTAADASIRGFRGAAFKFKYGLQGTLYKRGVKAITGKDFQFVFIVAEKSAPYDSAFYLMDERFLEWSKIDDDTIPDLLNKLHECQDVQDWPGYPDEIIRLSE